MQLKMRRMDRRGRMSWIGAGAAAAMLLSLATTLTAASGAGNKAASPRVRQGDAIFHQRCIVCHNKQPGDTTPFGPPNLHEIFKGPTALKTQDAATIITNGKGRMPAFGAILTKSEIGAVIAYLKAH
jgi:mono/diheme cytochrome c family protein